MKTLQVSDAAYNYIMQGSKDLGLDTADTLDQALLLLGRLHPKTHSQKQGCQECRFLTRDDRERGR